MYISMLKIENFRGIGEETTFNFNRGITVLVGENDCGKTTVIDAIRYVLGTTDQNWNKVELSDYNNEDTDKEIKISLCFSDLSLNEMASFMECLTYENEHVKLYLNWTAKYLKNIKPHRTLVNLTCGKNGDVTAPSPEARELLRVTYLKPLRDAHIQMKSGRNSRLAQILGSISDLNSGIEYSEDVEISNLSLSGIVDLSNDLLANHAKIKAVNNAINQIISNKMLLSNDSVKTEIVVSSAGNTVEQKMYSLLEKLDLKVSSFENNNCGIVGLGTSNLLSMACEMLLNSNSDNSSFMLIEEPEAHIHAQRQLKMMQSMIQEKNRNQQIIMTTHSLLLTSVVELENLIYVQNYKPYPMGKEYTCLDENDYRYLERYLDVTKANLFFARGVLIVEGPGEELLLPTLARLICRDLTDNGISIVDVRSTGLMRYARIFQRKDKNKALKIPVACITDRDVLPDCAPCICLKDEYKDENCWPKNRKWKVEKEIPDKENFLKKKKEKVEGQHVRVFISEQWTLEYELANSGLAMDMIDVISYMKAVELEKKSVGIEERQANLVKVYKDKYNSFNTKEEKAAYIYSFFSKKEISKAEFSQYFSEHLEKIYLNKNADEVEKLIPNYLVEAIKYVTSPLND